MGRRKLIDQDVWVGPGPAQSSGDGTSWRAQRSFAPAPSAPHFCTRRSRRVNLVYRAALHSDDSSLKHGMRVCAAHMRGLSIARADGSRLLQAAPDHRVQLERGPWGLPLALESLTHRPPPPPPLARSSQADGLRAPLLPRPASAATASSDDGPPPHLTLTASHVAIDPRAAEETLEAVAAARAEHRRELKGLALNALSTVFGTGMSLCAKISGTCVVMRGATAAAVQCRATRRRVGAPSLAASRRGGGGGGGRRPEGRAAFVSPPLFSSLRLATSHPPPFLPLHLTPSIVRCPPPPPPLRPLPSRQAPKASACLKSC